MKFSFLARARVIGPEGGAWGGGASGGAREGAAGVDVLVVSSSYVLTFGFLLHFSWFHAYGFTALPTHGLTPRSPAWTGRARHHVTTALGVAVASFSSPRSLASAARQASRRGGCCCLEAFAFLFVATNCDDVAQGRWPRRSPAVTCKNWYACGDL